MITSKINRRKSGFCTVYPAIFGHLVRSSSAATQRISSNSWMRAFTKSKEPLERCPKIPQKSWGFCDPSISGITLGHVWPSFLLGELLGDDDDGGFFHPLICDGLMVDEVSSWWFQPIHLKSFPQVVNYLVVNHFPKSLRITWWLITHLVGG